MRGKILGAACAAVFCAAVSLAGAQGAAGTPIPAAADPARAVALIANYCSACHGWASDYRTITAEGRIVPGKPAESRLFEYVESGYMPPSPPAPTPAEVEILRAWISAGAPGPEAVSGATEAGADAGSAASAGAAGKSGRFLGFKSKADYHRAAGWTSSGLLLAAGVVGAVRAYDLMSTAHAYRDEHGITEDTMDPDCYIMIRDLWSGDQALRWTHVSLLAAGETLYLGNAITGMSMARKAVPGEISKSDIHRWAFFTHAALMASEIVMGLFTTDALKRGDHELVSTLGVAHAAVGLAIPLVMIGAGIVIELPPPKKAAPPGE